MGVHPNEDDVIEILGGILKHGITYTYTYTYTVLGKTPSF